MNKMNLILQAVTIFASLLLISCEHKDLCYDHSHTYRVQVVFDWRNTPGASPETMRLYLFPVDGGTSQAYEFTDYRGGYINVIGRCVSTRTRSPCFTGTPTRSTALRPMPPKVS